MMINDSWLKSFPILNIVQVDSTCLHRSSPPQPTVVMFHSFYWRLRRHVYTEVGMSSTAQPLYFDQCYLPSQHLLQLVGPGMFQL